MTTASTSPITTWQCPRCASVASAGQRFCRQCGYRYPIDGGEADPSGEVDRSVPAMRPVSRVLIALIIVLFVVLGALVALMVDGIRNESDQPPSTTDAAAVVDEVAVGVAVGVAEVVAGTRPITNTD